MDLQTVETFFNTSWSAYDIALEHNYMFHREIYAELPHKKPKGKE